MNNEENQEITQEEIDSLKAQQAGKDLVDTTGKVAANYLAPGVGGEIYDAVANTEAGQKVLDTAGNIISQVPVVSDVLAKAQPAISKAKPAADMALGSKLNKASQAKSAVSGSNQLGENLNKTEIPKSSNNSLDSNLNNLSNPATNSSVTEEDNIDDNTSQNSFDSTTDTITNQPPKKKNIVFIIIIVVAVFLFMITAVLGMYFYSLKLTPYMMITQATDKLLNFVSGCGWSTDEECAEKQQNNFYEYVNTEYEKYKTEYSIELDRYLIIATLTYVDPFLTTNPETDEEGNEGNSSTIDYKKSKKQVNSLIANMAKQVDAKCYLYDKFGTAQELPCSEKDKYKEQLDTKEKYWVEKPIYILTPEDYRSYLENTFIIKYYLNNDKTDENKQKALEIVEEIYEMAEYYEHLMSEDQETTSSFVNNEVMVTVMDCPGNIMLEQVTLTDYLQGVVYMNSNNDSEDYLKFLAVLAKNYLYSVNGTSTNNMPQNLRVRNCKSTQLYCNVNEGCHYMDGSGEDNDTLDSGKDSNNSYNNGKAPLTDVENLSKIKKAVDETISYFIVDGNNIISTSLSDINKSEIMEQLYYNSYEDVLTNIYGGSIGEVNLFVSNYPLDKINNRVTSGFGWRKHPIKNNQSQYACRHHNGTDIAAKSGDNIYSIADGVVVEVGYNPNLQIGLGHYIKIGHGNQVNGYYEYYSVYAHMVSPPIVSTESNVKSGQVIGYVGNTGASTGDHLHIEIYSYVNGTKTYQDPVNYFQNVELTGIIGPMYSSEAACKSYN